MLLNILNEKFHSISFVLRYSHSYNSTALGKFKHFRKIIYSIIFFPDKQIDLSTVDLKKLKVRDLKKILSDWDENCDGCLEKTDFIKRIEELKPIYMRKEL